MANEGLLSKDAVKDELVVESSRVGFLGCLLKPEQLSFAAWGERAFSGLYPVRLSPPFCVSNFAVFFVERNEKMLDDLLGRLRFFDSVRLDHDKNPQA